MARQRLEGTPTDSRTKAYVFPSRSRRMLWASLGVAAVLAAVPIGLYFGGVRRTLLPGPVVTRHASFEVKCAQCHTPGETVTAVRCERCHDPSNSERLTHAAHILIGTGDPSKVSQANEQACQTCHVEHRGRAATLAAVDNRECAACHVNPETGARLSTFARHPEFAIVKAGATPGVGMKLSHKVHLEKLRELGRAETCSVCHEATPDQKTFQAMTFDRHCADSGCHLEGGLLPYKTETIDVTVFVPPAQVPRDVLGNSSPQIPADELGEGVVSGLRHRDGWTLFNALRLRTGIDPEGEEAERLTLRGRIGYLEALLRGRPVREVPAADLTSAIDSLERNIAVLDARLAQPRGPEAPALAELADASRAIARQLTGIDAALDQDLAGVVGARDGAPAPDAAAAAGSDAAALERRKAELLALLTAIDARTRDPGVQTRVASLRDRVKGVAPSQTGSAGAEPLLERLSALDGVFRSLAAIPDAGIQAELGALDIQRRYGQQQISAGLAPADFDARRRDLLTLLDAIEARGGDTLRPRTTVLRQRLLAMRPGTTGDEELRGVRRQQQRQLDRLRLELELQSSPRDQEPAPSEGAALDRRRIEALLGRFRSSLTALEAIAPMDPPESQETLDARRTAFKSLLTGPCTKCHVIEEARGRLAPVRIAEPVMPRSVFNHAPHLKVAKCEACHGSREPQIDPADPERKRLVPSIWRSTDAQDVNVPGKATCATCHAPSKTKDTCRTCHIYHASSPARLIAVNP